jgi:hypothetical protein
LIPVAIIAAIVLLGEIAGNIAVGKLLLQQAKLINSAAHTLNAAMLCLSSITWQVEHIRDTLARKEAQNPIDPTAAP